jgi:hypothetical protein
MFFNMRFKWTEMRFIFHEIKRVLRSKGLNFFSVRNRNDKSYGMGRKIENDGGDMYDLYGFQIRFFTEQQVKVLMEEEGFEILDIKQTDEEPVTLYLVTTRKR